MNRDRLAALLAVMALSVGAAPPAKPPTVIHCTTSNGLAPYLGTPNSWWFRLDGDNQLPAFWEESRPGWRDFNCTGSADLLPLCTANALGFSMQLDIRTRMVPMSRYAVDRRTGAFSVTEWGREKTGTCVKSAPPTMPATKF